MVIEEVAYFSILVRVKIMLVLDTTYFKGCCLPSIRREILLLEPAEKPTPATVISILFVNWLKAWVAESTVAKGDTNSNMQKPEHIASEAEARITIISLFDEV